MQSEDYAYLYELEEKFWWFSGMREITAALFDAACMPTTPEAEKRDRLILDAGCGTGGMLQWLTRYSGKVVGIDLVPTALKFCQERNHKRLAQASATALPFADGVFDIVTSFDVLVQIPGKGQDKRAISEMHRVLRPGGVAFVRAAAYQWMLSGHDKALGTQRRYNLQTLTQEMKQAGFHILRATYANSLLLPVAAMRRLILKRLQLVDSGSDVKPLPPKFEWLNQILKNVLYREARLLKQPGFNLKAGLSAICVARKPLSERASFVLSSTNAQH